MELKPGSIHDFTNSMAKAMEDALIREWPNAMGGQPAPETNAQMRLMFVAIAQGIVSHLKTNHDAFKVTVKNSGLSDLTGVVTRIDTDPDLL